MYRKLAVVTIVVLLLSLAFASVSFAQTGTGVAAGTQANANVSVSAQAKIGNQGASPEKPFTSLGNNRSLKSGEQTWFAFHYAGDNSPIQIQLMNASNMQFSVWTQQDVQNAAGNYGMAAQPVGRSTPNDQFGGNQYWTGSFNVPGTYYVMVENASGGQGGKFTLQITGSGVSFTGANANTTAASQDNESKESAKTAASEKSESSKTAASTSSNTSASSNTSTTAKSQTGTSTSTAKGGVAPSTLPTTGGEASVLPMLLGGIGALSVAAGAFLRRKK